MKWHTTRLPGKVIYKLLSTEGQTLAMIERTYGFGQKVWIRDKEVLGLAGQYVLVELKDIKFRSVDQAKRQVKARLYKENKIGSNKT